MSDAEIFGKLLAQKKQGKAICLATVVETEGSTPRDVGAKILVGVDGSLYGSIGGGCGENTVRSAALRCLVQGGKPELVRVDLTDRFGTREADVCGGVMWVFVEKAG